MKVARSCESSDSSAQALWAQVDGPQLLRLGLYGLRRELKLDKEVSDSRMASAQAKWEAWPWPPNLYNDTNSEMEQRASGHGGFDGTAPREVVTSLIENPSTPPASRESATAEAASTVLPPRSLLDRYIVVPQGEYGGAEHRYDRIRAALWGIFIADSLGMPAHWYYNPEQLRRDVGTIVGYRAAPRRHSGNTLMQSQWQGNKHGVRDLVDKFMLFGKASAWKTPYQHFHAGMQAGENTLNARCALLLVQSIASNNGQYVQQRIQQQHPHKLCCCLCVFVRAVMLFSCSRKLATHHIRSGCIRWKLIAMNRLLPVEYRYSSTIFTYMLIYGTD